ncbi:MAG: DUF1232 domain-containing protein, partial [Cytophagales bacterium]|nr:DUF1232 domain-containing protein [Cytophagales bacterium]
LSTIFVNPFDLIPDFIVGFGLIDDMTLMVWILKNIQKDIEAYRRWEVQEKEAKHSSEAETELSN